VPALAAGESRVRFNATATTTPGQHVYVTGNTAALGNWDTDLAVPVDPRSYPVWFNHVNMAGGSAVQYKYFRRNADGTVTWENLPGGGNRSVTMPAAGGSITRNDTVAW
jgi:glucoamylase